MNKQFQKKAYRDAFVGAFVRNTIAHQIQALRQSANLSQADLARRANKKQSVISRLENPSYGSYSLKTLLELASTFDVGLVVRFASFSSVERLARNASAEAMSVATFDDDDGAAELLGTGDTDYVRCESFVPGTKTFSELMTDVMSYPGTPTQMLVENAQIAHAAGLST